MTGSNYVTTRGNHVILSEAKNLLFGAIVQKQILHYVQDDRVGAR